MRIAFANDTGGEIKNKELPGGGNVENFQLVDFLNKRKYNVLRTSDGACLCTSLNPLTSSEPGKRTLWAKFTAPPESVTRISLLLPEAEPVDDQNETPQPASSDLRGARRVPPYQNAAAVCTGV